MAVLWLIFQFPMLGMFWRPVAGLAGGLLVALIVIFCARDISRPRFVLIVLVFLVSPPVSVYL